MLHKLGRDTNLRRHPRIGLEIAEESVSKVKALCISPRA